MDSRYVGAMPHIVNRRGYLSLEESYRDEHGRPRKRVLAYYGKSDPRRDRMLATAERKAEEWDEWQRAEFGETGAERAARLESEKQFAPEKFLETTQVNYDTSQDDAQDDNEGGEEKGGDDSVGEGHN